MSHTLYIYIYVAIYLFWVCVLSTSDRQRWIQAHTQEKPAALFQHHLYIELWVSFPSVVFYIALLLSWQSCAWDKAYEGWNTRTLRKTSQTQRRRLLGGKMTKSRGPGFDGNIKALKWRHCTIYGNMFGCIPFIAPASLGLLYIYIYRCLQFRPWKVTFTADSRRRLWRWYQRVPGRRVPGRGNISKHPWKFESWK